MGFSVCLKKRLGNFLLDVSWEMDNELLVLFGPSGAGKSLTLQMIAGLIEPDDGFIYSGTKTLFDKGAATNIPPPAALPWLCVSRQGRISPHDGQGKYRLWTQERSKG